jgi:parvulin-like peptidyl-prolyl isomerase
VLSSLVILAACAAAILRPCTAWGADQGILARVNGEPVTRAELQRVMADSLVRGQLQHELGVQAVDGQELDRLALRVIIKRRLILQEAGRRELAVSEREVDEAVTALRRRFPDLTTFGPWLKERGLNDQSLFDAIRSDLLVTRVRTALVEGLQVTDEQTWAYYQARKGELKTSEAVRVRIIVAPDRAAAQRILTRVQAGEDFDRVAHERASQNRGGQARDMGWAVLAKLPLRLREALGALKIGETGGPVQLDTEFLVVRLEERRLPRPKTLAEARPEIERLLLAARQRDVLRAWLAGQEKQSTIEVLQ